MTAIDEFAAFEEKLKEEYGHPQGRIFTVSGLTGAGTSTISKFLCEEYNLDHWNAGYFFRDLAEEFDLDIEEFERMAKEIENKTNRDFDRECDERTLSFAYQNQDVVMEGRLTGALLNDIAQIRVFVKCDNETSAQRLMERESFGYAEAMEYLRVRNQEVIQRYIDRYDIDPRNERYYNIVINNSGSIDQTKSLLKTKVEQIISEEEPK